MSELVFGPADPAPAPAWAGRRPGRYDAHRCIYNYKASNTRNLRDNAATAAAGLGLCRIGVIGDSLHAGTGQTPGSTDPVARLGKLISNGGMNSGFLAPFYNATTLDSRLATTDAAYPGSATRPLVLFGASTTLTVTGVGTVFEAVLAANVSSGVTYKVDGGSAVTLTASASPYFTQLTITGLSNASHTVVFTIAAGGSLYGYAAGFRQAAGFVLHNAAMSGTTTGGWLANDGPGLYGPLWTFVHPDSYGYDAVLISLGGNDALQTLGAAGVAANLATIATRVRAIDADPILVCEYNVLGTNTAWDAYASAVYDAADAVDCPVIDMYDTVGPLSERVQEGQDAGDNLHLNAKGGALLAQMYAAALIPRNAT